MRLMIGLCLLLGLIDAQPTKNSKVLRPLDDTVAQLRMLDNQVDSLRVIGQMVSQAEDLLETYDGEFDDLECGQSAYSIVADFRDNQNLINYIEYFVTDHEGQYPPQVIDGYLEKVRAMRCTFWQLEAQTLLNWARELRPDSLMAVGRVESIKRNTNLSLEEFGTDKVEFYVLQKNAVRQMQEAVECGLK